MAWYSNYKGRRVVQVDGSVAGAQTDLQMKLKIWKGQANAETPNDSANQGSDRASLYVGMNKVITANGKMFVTYSDYVGGSYKVVVQSYDLSEYQWSPKYLSEAIYDDHCSATMAMDSQGYLYIIYGKHAQYGTLYQRKSTNPYDLS